METTNSCQNSSEKIPTPFFFAKNPGISLPFGAFPVKENSQKEPSLKKLYTEMKVKSPPLYGLYNALLWLNDSDRETFSLEEDRETKRLVITDLSSVKCPEDFVTLVERYDLADLGRMSDVGYENSRLTYKELALLLAKNCLGLNNTAQNSSD